MYRIVMFVASSLLCHPARSFGLVGSRALQTVVTKCDVTTTSTSTTSLQMAALSEQDEGFLLLALEHARNGSGRTFPNPAVGCVLVQQDSNEVIGSGFHPRAGSPHAEVFALLEAAGHVPSGVEAAKSVSSGEDAVDDTIASLTSQYTSSDTNGPQELFGETFQSTPVTAYVTLEPCCHHGKTPPCASALVLAQVNRVVVGFRDPNPRVDGGGVQLLEEAGISVDMAAEGGKLNKACGDIIECFVKRITPKEYDSADYPSWINGAMRSALRKRAGQKKADDSLAQVTWPSKAPKASTEDGVDDLPLDPKWMERVDALLWKGELVNLRLNKAVGKKKLARRLGEKIATVLGAHVAQTVGHTVLLYRPGVPAELDLEKLIDEQKNEEEEPTVDESEFLEKSAVEETVEEIES